MNKLISVLIAGLFTASAYAADVTAEPAPAEKTATHVSKPHHAGKKHQHALKKTAPTETKAEDAAK